MKHRYFGVTVVICLLVFLINRSLRDPPAEQGATSGLIVEPALVELGPIFSDSGLVVAKFVLKNRTSRVIHPRVVSTSCGCAEAKAPASIEARAESPLLVSIDARRKIGPVRVRVVLASDAEADSEKEVLVHYDAIPRIVIDPAVVTVELSEGESAARNISVITRVSKGEKAIAPTVESASPDLTAVLESTSDKQDPALQVRRVEHVYHLKWNPSTPGTRLGDPISNHTLSFRIGEQDPAVLDFRVITKRHPYFVGPTAVVFKSNSAELVSIRLWGRDRRAFEFDRAEYPKESLELVKNDNGPKVVWEVQFRRVNSPPEGRQSTIRLYFKGHDLPYVVNAAFRD